MRAVTALVAVLAVGLAGAGPARAGVLAGLGDSFSAGDGAPPYDPVTDLGSNPCRRSADGAWPGHLARMLGHRLQHVACSGAEAPEVVDGLPRDRQPMRRTAQLAQMLPRVDVVTLTIGGNDIGFADVVATCLALPRCERHFGRPEGDRLDARIDRFVPTLAAVYDRLRRRAGTARVVIIGYPRLLPDDGAASCAGGAFDISVDEASYLNRRTGRLNRAIARTARRSGFEFADVTEAFDGAELRCGRVGFVNPVPSNPFEILGTPATPFHPNAAGQRRLAETAFAQLGRDQPSCAAASCRR